MNRITVLIVALCISACSAAQQMNDVLYLLNGSVIKGKIIEQNKECVKIKTCCGNIFVYEVKDILRTDHEKSEMPVNTIKSKGYLNFTTLGVLVGSTDSKKSAPFSACMEHEYRFNKFVATGFFIGFEQLNENVMPLGVNLKTFLPAGNSVIFISVSGGHSFSLEKPGDYGLKSASGGVITTAEIGIVIPVSESTGLVAAVGYRYSELNYKMENWWTDKVDRKVKFNRFSLRLGLSIY